MPVTTQNYYHPGQSYVCRIRLACDPIHPFHPIRSASPPFDAEVPVKCSASPSTQEVTRDFPESGRIPGVHGSVGRVRWLGSGGFGARVGQLGWQINRFFRSHSQSYLPG